MEGKSGCRRPSNGLSTRLRRSTREGKERETETERRRDETRTSSTEGTGRANRICQVVSSDTFASRSPRLHPSAVTATLLSPACVSSAAANGTDQKSSHGCLFRFPLCDRGSTRPSRSASRPSSVRTAVPDAPSASVNASSERSLSRRPRSSRGSV